MARVRASHHTLKQWTVLCSGTLCDIREDAVCFGDTFRAMSEKEDMRI